VSVKYLPIANLRGDKGDRGDPGPAGPASADGLLTDDAIAANMKNRETKTSTETSALVEEIVAALVPIEVWIKAGGNIATARPDTPAPVKWFSAVGYPTYLDASRGDVYYAISLDPLSFSPPHRKGLFGWLDPRKTGFAAGASMPTYPEQGPQKLTLTQWAISGSGATQTPALATMNGTPAVNYLSRSGHSVAVSVSSPACVVLGMNFQFTGAQPGTLNQHANSMGDEGKYSIQRTPSGTWAASIDGNTNYNFGSSDNNPHSAVLVATKSKLQVWLEGNLALDQDVAFQTLPIPSIFRFGYVGTVLGLAMGGGMIGDAYAYAPPAAPANSDISIDSQWLKARRGV
jgi:hypothetical protein